MRKKQPGALTPEAFFSFSWRNTAVCIGILAAATGLCFLLRLLDDSDVYVALIFELAVVLVSRFTSGYFYGLLASVVGVIGVNYIFTYPYFAFNFTISGYPLTFLVMLAVSIVVSALTTQIKQQEKLRAEAEKEKMRSNLLRAVSHDIRTPLTSIVGGVNAILDSGDRMTPETQTALLTDIRTEAQWLVGVVENLLSVTRISGASTIHKELEAGEELLSAASVKFRKRFPEITVSIRAPEELLMIPMDAILIEQVLINLMENAALHGGSTTRIELHLRREGDSALFEVADNGRRYDRLSLSEKIRAGAEVSELVKRLTGRNYPVFFDNMESVDDLSNIRPTSQMILAKCVRNAELSVRAGGQTMPKAA